MAKVIKAAVNNLAQSFHGLTLSLLLGKSLGEEGLGSRGSVH